MAEYRFSDFAPNSSPSGVDELVGLSGGDNARFTLSVLSDFFQSQISTVDPLPAGTPAKVMYFNADTNEWGASINFVTDGYVVGIGNQTPAEDTLLNIENYNDAYNSALNIYNKNSSDVITKMVNYSRFGIMHITEGSVFANIDNADRSNDYGLFVENGILANSGMVMVNDGSARIQFGTIDITDGSLEPKSTIYTDDSVLKTISSTQLAYIGTETNSRIMTRIGLNTGSNLKKFDIGGASDIQSWTSIADVPSNHGTLWGFSEITGTPPYIGRVAVGNRGGTQAYLSISNTSDPIATGVQDMFLYVDSSGKICMKLPTTAGGSPTGVLKQLWNDGGILKVSDY